MTNLRHLHTCILASLLAALASCRKGTGNAISAPAPGAMVVLSMEPLLPSAAARRNLIPNGDFNEWYAGAPYFAGFDPPSAPEVSSIVRRDCPGGPGRYAVEQTWLQGDAELPPNQHFRSGLKGVTPGAHYRFEVTAVSLNPGAANVILTAWEWNGLQARELMRPLFRLEGGTNLQRTYIAEFKNGPSRLLLLSASLEGTPAGPVRVLWKEWRLTQAATP